jgi:hypothetical protein
VAGALLRSAVEMLDFDSFGFVHEGMRRQAPEPLHYELTLSPIEAERGGRFRFTIPVQRPDQLLFEERDIEVVVPAGVRDGARAGLTLDGRIVDVTVRME